MSDLADRAVEREEEFLSDRLRKQQIEAALDAPGSDACTECGGAIPEPRRRAMPSAVRCIECQELAELLEKVQAREGRDELI